MVLNKGRLHSTDKIQIHKNIGMLSHKMFVIGPIIISKHCKNFIIGLKFSFTFCPKDIHIFKRYSSGFMIMLCKEKIRSISLIQVESSSTTEIHTYIVIYNRYEYTICRYGKGHLIYLQFDCRLMDFILINQYNKLSSMNSVSADSGSQTISSFNFI